MLEDRDRVFIADRVGRIEVEAEVGKRRLSARFPRDANCAHRMGEPLLLGAELGGRVGAAVAQDPGRRVVAIGARRRLVAVSCNPLEIRRLPAPQKPRDSARVGDTQLLADVGKAVGGEPSQHQRPVRVLLVDEMIGLADIGKALSREHRRERRKHRGIEIAAARIEMDRALARPCEEAVQRRFVGGGIGT